MLFVMCVFLEEQPCKKNTQVQNFFLVVDCSRNDVRCQLLHLGIAIFKKERKNCKAYEEFLINDKFAVFHQYDLSKGTFDHLYEVSAV